MTPSPNVEARLDATSPGMPRISSIHFPARLAMRRWLCVTPSVRPTVFYSNRLMPALGLALWCTGCMVVPRTIESFDPDCRLTQRQIVLDVEQVQVLPGPCSDNRACAGVLFVLGAVGAGSAIVSGTIAVVGNVAYWLERKTTCATAPEPTQPVKPVPEPVSAVLQTNERSSMPQQSIKAAALTADEVLVAARSLRPGSEVNAKSGGGPGV